MGRAAAASGLSHSSLSCGCGFTVLFANLAERSGRTWQGPFPTSADVAQKPPESQAQAVEGVAPSIGLFPEQPQVSGCRPDVEAATTYTSTAKRSDEGVAVNEAAITASPRP